MRIYRLGLLFVVLLLVLPLLSLLHPGLPITHDGQDHVARIANFYQSLSEGNLIPRWAGNLNWGYGHPVMMFLYPLPSYAASLFHLIGFGFVDSTKIVFGFAYIAAGIAMYLFLKEIFDTKAAIVGAIVYSFAPYRFIDLYVRGAIGEHVAFIFPPLICFFATKFASEKFFNRFYFVALSLSVAGLILSHNALSIMFFPFVFAYLVYLLFTSKRKKMWQALYFAGSFFLGVGLSSFFLIPAYLEGKYTLRDIVTEGVALTRFVDFKSLFTSPWNFGQTGQFSVEIGFVILAAILLSPFVFLRLKKKRIDLCFYLFVLIYLLFSVFIMLPESKFIWEQITILQKFQFPWRFLSSVVLAGAVLSAFVVSIIRNEKAKSAVAIIIIGFCLISTINFWQPKDYLQKNESFYTGIYNGTTDTGESSPIWSVRFMEKRPVANIEILKGEGNVTQVLRTTTEHKYKVEAESKIRLRENTLYFPGWRVYIDGKRYNDIQFQDASSRGLITFYVPEGQHEVNILFADNRLRTISNYISVASAILLFAVLFKTYSPSKT